LVEGGKATWCWCAAATASGLCCLPLPACSTNGVGATQPDLIWVGHVHPAPAISAGWMHARSIHSAVTVCLLNAM
jgi:hypothetical protein